MEIVAQILGVLAVVAMLLSYQQKKRRGILLLGGVSRVLCVLQYLLLGAYSGAVLDVIGTVSTAVAERKGTSIVKRFLPCIIVVINIAMLTAGITLAVQNRSAIDVFAILGVLFEVNALWLTREQHIRWVSLIGSPCWLIYNLLSGAYGVTIGNVFVIVSIIVGLIRYREQKE